MSARALGVAAGAVVAAVGIVGIVGIAACDGGGAAASADAAGEVGAPVPPEIDWCDEAPLVTWENFGAGFLLENCQPCHARAAAERHDAPAEIAFDTRADVALLRDAILDQAVGDDPPMPPAGGVSAEDRALLEAWLLCAVE